MAISDSTENQHGGLGDATLSNIRELRKKNPT